MPYVVTNPTWFSQFANGTFESGTPLPTDAVGGTSVSITPASTAEAQAGTKSMKIDMNSVTVPGAIVGPGGTDRQQNMVRLKTGNPIVAARRYQISIWFKVTNPGVSGPTNMITIGVSLGLEGFPASGGADIADFRTIYSAGGWVQCTGTILPPASIAAGSATLALVARWRNGQITPVITPPQSPLTGSIVYIDTITVVESEFVTDPSPIVTGVVTNSSPGGADGDIDVSVSGGTGPYSYLWGDGATTQDRADVPAGTYTVVVTDTATGTTTPASFVVGEFAALTATASTTNPTADAATDGEIFLTVSGGSGSRSYLWLDGPTTANRTGLPEGTYHVTVTDVVTGQVVELDVVLTDPGPAVIPGSFVDFPKMQSLQMVISSTIDPNDNPQQLDNVLFCQQVYSYYSKCDYTQKVSKYDVFPLQWNSDFENFTVTLKDRKTNAEVRSFSWELKEENIGLLEEYSVTLRNHTEAGKLRVYFNVGAIPIPLAVGDNFEILNNLDGYDGNYSIIDIIQDVFLGYQFLVINETWSGPGSSSAATGKFQVSTAEFNVFEASLSFLGLADGGYYIELRAANSDITVIGLSEPIDLKVEHPETNCIDFRNFDNAFGVTWQTGITCRIRVESQFFKRLPGGERVVSRNSNYSLVKVNAKKTRGMLFETFQLPPYLHEKLSCVFDMDYFAINQLECQAADAYADPQYLTRYPLANSSIKLEVKEWFDRYNSHDIGSISDGGFIMTETGFLKR